MEILKRLKINCKLFYYVSSNSNYILNTMTIKYFTASVDDIFHNDSLILRLSPRTISLLTILILNVRKT